MLQSVQGVFRDGKVEFTEPVPRIEQARVLITFLPESGPIDLQKLRIDTTAAVELRSRFGLIAEDWERPEMDVYDE